jgi:hypothetical protein
MPCYVDFPTSEKDAPDFPASEEPIKTDSKAFKKMKKRGERAEEALCLLAREVIATQPSILVGLLLKYNKFYKTWEKHQKHDRKAGRSYYTFDVITQTLLFWATVAEGKTNVSSIPNTPLEGLTIPKGATEQLDRLCNKRVHENQQTETKPIVRVGAVSEIRPDDLSITAIVKKLIEEQLNGKDKS